MSKEAAYTASFSEVYASRDQQVVELEAIVGKCTVLPSGAPLPGDTFVVVVINRKGCAVKLGATPRSAATHRCLLHQD